MVDFENMKNCTNSCKIEKKKERLKRRSFATKGPLSNIKDGLFDFVSNIALYELAKDIFTHISDKTSSVANLMNDEGDQGQTRQSIFDDPEDDIDEFDREDIEFYDNDYDDMYEE